MQGRIWFPGNPWPDGHRIAEFNWTGRLNEDGRLWFDFTLVSADYYEEADPPDGDTPLPDWASPMAWGNYHRCRISSTYWADEGDEAGLLAGEPGRPFPLGAAEPQVLQADPLPIGDPEDLAFFVYLLGHDTVADHTVTFTPAADGTYRIDWTGRIALTYMGEEEFTHEFRAEVTDLTLGQIEFPETMSAQDAAAGLALTLEGADSFTSSPLVPGALLPKL